MSLCDRRKPYTGRLFHVHNGQLWHTICTANWPTLLTGNKKDASICCWCISMCERNPLLAVKRAMKEGWKFDWLKFRFYCPAHLKAKDASL